MPSPRHTLVVIDDDSDYLAMLRATLPSTHGGVHWLTTPGQAHELDWTHVTTAALDFDLHDVETGVDIASWLAEEHEHIQTLVFTGNVNAALAAMNARGLDLQVIEKPLDAPTLLRVLDAG